MTCLDILSSCLKQGFITHRMQLSHVNPNVGGLEQVLHLFGVRIEARTVNVDVGW